MVIIDYYKSLSHKGKSQFIRDVVGITGIGYSTFFLKMKNNSFKKLEEEAIIRYINSTSESND